MRGAQARVRLRNGTYLAAALMMPPLLVSCSIAHVANPGPITVGGNIQVSAARPNTRHVEVMIAADPTNAHNLVTCSILQWTNTNGFNDSSTAAYASHDDGATWSPAVSNPIGSWDPSCAYDSAGRAYFISGGNFEKHLALLRSNVTGGRWTSVEVPHFVDRPWVTTFRRDLYVTYTPTSQVHLQELRVSRNGGKLFSAPIGYGRWPPRRSPSEFTPSAPVVLADGTYVQAWQLSTYVPRGNSALQLWSEDSRLISKPNGAMFVATLRNNAESLDVVRAFDTYGEPYTVPALASDGGSSPFKNRLYLAWDDAREGRAEILVAYSTNDGRSWSAPRVVDNEPFTADFNNGPDDVTPTLAVNRDGVVGVTWEDRRDNPDDLGYYVRFSASLDGGYSWLPSVRVSERPNTVGGRSGGGIAPWITQPKSSLDPVVVELSDSPWITQGHTAGLAADRNGVFHALWIDNRMGVPQMWTAPIAVNATVSRYGDPSLNGFDDVTPLVEIQAVDSGYDALSRRVWITLQIENRTKRVLKNVKVQISGVRSPLADATISRSTYDVFPTLLKPGHKSKAGLVSVALSDVRPEDNAGISIFTLARLELRVLAQPSNR